MLFAPTRGSRPGPKGPAQELIDAVVTMKGEILPGVVRELLSKSRWPSAWILTRTWCAGFLENITGLDSGSGGPSWLTFLGQAKDGLWSIDLFRCESLSLRTHWVLVVMDQFTRRIIGFGRTTADLEAKLIAA